MPWHLCIHFFIYALFPHLLFPTHVRERETNVVNLVLSPTNEGGQIHLKLVAILLTPTFQFDRLSASSMLK